MAHALRHLICADPSAGERCFRPRRECAGRGGWSKHRVTLQWLHASLIAAWALFAPALTAKGQAPRAAEQAGRFTVFAARPVADLGFAPRAGAARLPVVFYPTARSPRYEYRSAMPLRFTDGSSGAVVASVTIPPDIREALLLFSPVDPAPTTGLRYQVAVLDDSALRHGAGSLVVINLSGLDLSGTLGNQEVNLTAGLNAPMPAGASAKLVLRTAAGGRSFQAYAGELQLKKNERALLLLWPPFYKGSQEVQSRLLVDNPTALAAAAPARK